MDEQSKSSLQQEIESANEVIDKLKTFTNELEKRDNNILTHLCDGLQTFLGYDKTSKGYNGSGIVYSDLDRLCDGVMGFLSGVLSNIQTHLGQHKNALHSAIESLETNKHAGKEGFNVAIGKVVEWVGRYNKEVKKSNDEVKQIVTDFQEYTKTGGKLLNDLHNIQVDDGTIDKGFNKAKTQVESTLAECKKNAETFTNDLNVNLDRNIHKDAINDLNSDLKNKLENVRRTVRYESERLERVRAQETEELKSMEEKIKATLKSMKYEVHCKIDTQVKTLIRNIRGKVDRIMGDLKKISSSLLEHLDALQGWIDKADPAVKKTLEKVDKILHEVDVKSTFSKPRDISEAAQELHKQVHKLFDAGNEANKAADEQVKAALAQVKSMDEALKEDLYTVKQAVNAQVDEIKNAIGKLYKVVESGTENGAGEVEKAMLKIMETIRDRIKEITGPEGGREHKGLIGIAKKVAEHTGKFKSGSQGFEKIVKSWVDEIVNRENGLIKYWVLKYINYNRSLGYFGNHITTESLQTKVLQAFQERIKTVIESAIESAVKVDQVTPASDASSIQLNIAALLKCINGFSDALETEIKNSNNVANMRVSELAKNIEQSANVMDHYKVNVTDKTHLYDAVKTTFDQLLATSRQRAADLQLFAQSKQNTVGTIVDTIRPVAESLHDKLKTVLGKPPNADPVVKYRNNAVAVDTAIEGVKTTLGKQLPPGDNGRVKLEGAPSFNEYNGFVDQTPGKLSGDIDDLAGTLPDAIKKIRTDVQRALEDIGKFTGVAQEKFNVITDKLRYLCDAINEAAGGDPNDRQYNDSAKAKLLLLKDRYFKEYTKDAADANESINKIKHDLTEVRTTLETGPIQETNELLTFLTAAETKFPEVLKDEIHKDIQKATDELTTHARKTYVESIKFLLTEFARKVTGELEPLPREIDADLEIGFKGFMKDFHVPLANNLRRDDYTVHKLSYAFKLCFGPWQMLLEREIGRVDKEERKRKNRAPTVSEVTYTKKLKSVFGALDDVLMHFTGKNGYDHETHGKLDKLEAEIAALKPETFAKPNTAILDSIAAGVIKFVGEMRSVYISKYDRALLTDDLTTNHQIKVTTEKSENTYDLTAYGRKCSKVCLTVFSILFNALVEMRTVGSGDGKFRRIYASTQSKKNKLGDFFTRCGYKVSDHGEQNGELVCKDGVTGSSIVLDLCNSCKLFNNATAKDHSGLLEDLLDYLHLYYQVCHLSTTTSRKHPSSIYDMLCWLAGLTYSTVHQELTLNGFDKLFEKPEKVPAPGDDRKAILVVSENDDNLDSNVPLRVEAEGSLDAYPKAITPSMLTDILPEVCTYSEIVLIALLGHGHADGIYACDFNTNPQGFQYPTNMDTLVCMLCEIVNRLYNQLYFLFDQCKRSTLMSGWRECEYGQGVGGSGWRCNDLSCGDCNSAEKCKRHPKCGVKSPLQSYLEDGLRGFLPHNLDGKSGKLNCPVKSHTNGPCTTPMGFKDISTMASHRYTGRHIRDVLAEFCGTASSPLTALCSMLRCVLPSAPKTFDQLFAFYYSLLVDWDNQKNKSRITHREEAFKSAVIAANFENPSTQLEIAPMFGTTRHHSGNHSSGALYSLLSCNPGSRSSHACGPYMKPICSDVSTTFTVKHADRYLSSVLYLTESFYNVLQQLFEECNTKCGKAGTRCSTKSCAKGCERQQTKRTSTDRSHDHACISVVSCQSTLPILYKYGFIFNDAESLNGAKRINTKRTCVEFCKTLENVVKEGSVLYNLVHKTIPEFLFTIRAPFIWLTVALWSLSLFYLICVMVGRLDVLHIRSHLRIPSSHKITAQSLLAAAQVGRLAKISYLQP